MHITGQLAEVYGRSDAEIRVMFGVAVVAGGIAAALRTIQVLDDLELLPSSHRPAAVRLNRGRHGA
jgi:hypothetical protein